MPMLTLPSRPLFDLLTEVAISLLSPREPAAPGRIGVRAAPSGRYAAFDAPTWQRRGLRIPGLEPERGTMPASVCGTVPGEAPPQSAGARRAAGAS